MSLKSLYTVCSQRTNDSQLHISLIFNLAHKVYKGHFPDNPITPGVCLLHVAKELTEMRLNTSLRIDRILSVKFLRLVIPSDECYTYHISILEKSEINMKVRVLIKRDDVVYATAQIIYHIN